MRKHKKNKQRGSIHSLQNCVGVNTQKEVETEKPKKDEIEPVNGIDVNDDIETEDIRVDSILSDGKDSEVDTSFRVEIPRNVYYKMLTYCKLLDDEISGLGYVERIGTNAFKITDVYLLKQTVSAATCDLDIDSQCELMQKLIADGKNPSNLKFWWHSHAKMGANWSAQDDRTGKEVACDYYISLVINHSGEMRCRLNIYQPISFEIDNVKVVMIDNENIADMIKGCIEEVKQKVFKEKSRVITGFDNNYHNRHWRDRAANNASVGGQKELFDTKKNADELENDIQQQFFGNHFTVGDFSFVWDDEVKMYNVYDKTNKKLIIDEVEKEGLMKYADPKYFKDDANEDITLNGKERTMIF